MKEKKIITCLLLLSVCFMQLAIAQSPVLIQRVPDDGIQPRLLSDRDGDIHLLYFRKLNPLMPKRGDLYYRRYLQDRDEWTSSVRVSAESYNLSDPIGRAGLAIDGSGVVHVVWYNAEAVEYLYTRSNQDRTQFAAPRSIVTDYIEGIDAGAEITASGNTVAVVWAAGSLMHESERTVFTRLSLDAGNSFGEEQRLSDPAYGACACCGLATSFLSEDELAVAFRSAVDGNGRHMQLLSSTLDRGVVKNSYDYFNELHPLQKWELSGCPVTTNDFTRQQDPNNWLVFESQGRIVQLDLKDDNSVALVRDAKTETRQKNPAIAFNNRHEKLIVWGEAPGYVKGGELGLQLYTSDGTELPSESAAKQAEGVSIPDYSFPAVTALRDGRFLILY